MYLFCLLQPSRPCTTCPHLACIAQYWAYQWVEQLAHYFRICCSDHCICGECKQCLLLAVVSLSMAIAMPLVLCNFKPRSLNDWTCSMVVPLYVNSGAALQHFSNTTTLVLLTLMTNCRSTQNSDKSSIYFCNLCGVSDINAKSSAYNNNLTTMFASCGGLSPSSASRCFSSPSR